MFRKIAWIGATTVFLCASTSAAELLVTVTDIRTTKGSLRLGIYNSEAAWNGNSKPVTGRTVAADATEIKLRFEDLPPGSYAVQVLHDENDNAKMDTNLVGIPSEGYGFSNNPQVMRRARFDEARFEVSAEGTAIVIRLR